jgi:hypothetical protein
MSLTICACTSSHAARDDERTYVSRTGLDEDRARERAADDLSGATFEDVGDTSTCTIDCSGHEAGFEWAREHDVTDESECGGTSQSFQEGCQSYAQALEDRVDDAGAEHEAGDDDGDERDEYRP